MDLDFFNQASRLNNNSWLAGLLMFEDPHKYRCNQM